MSELSQTPASTEPVNDTSTTPGSSEPAQTQPKEPITPDPKPGTTEEPVPTDPAPQTPSPALPDHGVDPDNPIDPDAGDLPTDPNHNTGDPDASKETESEDSTPDVKSMSRAERAAYYSNIEANTRKAVAEKVEASYKPQALDDLTQKYIDEGHSEFEAKVLAREEIRDQEADISRATAERAQLNATLAIEATEVQSSIDWLNPSNKEAYDKKSSDAAIQLYDQLCLTRDDNTVELDDAGKPIPHSGQIIAASMTPKQFYGLIDTIRSSGTEVAKLSAQKAAEEQMAAVAAPSSNTSKRDQDFDSLSNEEKRAALQAKGVLVT